MVGLGAGINLSSVEKTITYSSFSVSCDASLACTAALPILNPIGSDTFPSAEDESASFFIIV
jgi:hypothetical protein